MRFFVSFGVVGGGFNGDLNFIVVVCGGVGMLVDLVEVCSGVFELNWDSVVFGSCCRNFFRSVFNFGIGL